MRKGRAAIVAIDVVGYSAMVGADEQGALNRLRSWQETLLRPIVHRHHGRIFKTMGDGFLVEFPLGTKAVQCAQELQLAMQPTGTKKHGNAPLNIRVGINEGDLYYQDDDVLGDCVNVAARLEGMAAPGGILVSDDVLTGLDDELTEVFHDNGNRKFKNIPRPIRVWSWPEKLPPLREATKPRVFVVGFSSRGADEEDVADMLASEVQRRLGQLTGMEVVQNPDAGHYVIKGSARQSKSRTRVGVQLNGADDGRQIWAERYDLDSVDPFDVADLCAPRLVMSIRRRVAADDARRLREKPLDELSFEDLLALAGASFFNPTFEGWHGAGLIAEHALAIEPNAFMALAMAAAGLGLANPFYSVEPIPHDVLMMALGRITAAIRANNRSDMLHSAHAGLLLHGQGRSAEALTAVNHALEVNPDYNMGLWTRGSIEIFSGDAEQGISSSLRAIDVAADDPYVHLYSRTVGHGHLCAGRPDVALEWFRKADQLAPELPPNLLGLTICTHMIGNREEAKTLSEALIRNCPTFRLSLVRALPIYETDLWKPIWNGIEELGLPN